MYPNLDTAVIAALEVCISIYAVRVPLTGSSSSSICTFRLAADVSTVYRTIVEPETYISFLKSGKKRKIASLSISTARLVAMTR